MSLPNLCNCEFFRLSHLSWYFSACRLALVKFGKVGKDLTAEQLEQEVKDYVEQHEELKQRIGASVTIVVL